ncbi:MAG: hypothetical protein E7378_02805 [Clostridiales bacterium]|nr:hypothetical protein [Clostridiales bacterium]
MGFKDFQKQYTANTRSQQNFSNIDQTNAKQVEQKVEDLYNKYKGKDQDQLLTQLFENVQKQKSEGTFDYQKLCAMIDKISPFLSVEQQQKIKSLLAKIK